MNKCKNTRKHKYLNDIGIPSTNISVPHTTNYYKENQLRFIIERDTFGFDSREIWNLDSTSAMWLYSHLKMYLAIADKHINLFEKGAHEYTIPVLKPLPKDKLVCRPGWNYPEDFYYETNKNMYVGDAICYVIAYLETYLKTTHSHKCTTTEQDIKVSRILTQAFKIYSIIINSIWW